MFASSSVYRSVAIAALCLFLTTSARAQEGALTPNAQSLKTDLLVVTAHPDDESMMAATMARYADQGKVISLVIATHGEGGGNGTGKESGASLGIVREAELRRCLSLLGTRFLYSLNQPDWAYTESVQATLNRWGHDESLRRLVRLVRLLRPEVVCTMDPAPVGGQHGHHQAAGRLATEAFEAAADPRAFPELAHEEGLSPWRVRKLYWVSFSSGTLLLPTDGMVQGALATASLGKRYADIATEAERNHRSQGFDKFMPAPSATTTRPPARPNSFLLVKSRVPTDPKAEHDLFDGISNPLQESIGLADRLTDGRESARTPDVEARLQPNQPTQNYLDWLKANRIERLTPRIPARASVTIGQASPIVLEVINHSAQVQTRSVDVAQPAGWRVEKKEGTKSLTLRPGETVRIPFLITPPAGTEIGTYSLQPMLWRGSTPSMSGINKGALDAVPGLSIRRLATPLPVDADTSKWEKAGFAATAIPHTNTAQGRVSSAREASGRFFVGYDAQGLQVLVDVTDDTVALNIEPDDVKAHWRSTSVEIDLDPNPRAENTFSTLKLGLFPQDTSGRVRGLRDADANPGPVDEKEPGIRLASQLTPKGYCIEARIPWSALRMKPAFSPRAGRTLGFNIILFHAGKRDARVGEDVGKSRLAWSFWPGVWGRPGVWGTAVLK